MTVLVQLGRITRIQLQGRCHAEIVATQVIGVVFRLLLSVKAIEQPYGEGFAKRLSRPFQGGVRPAVKLDARVGTIDLAPIDR